LNLYYATPKSGLQMNLNLQSLTTIALALLTLTFYLPADRSQARSKSIILQSATSPENAGLYRHILPIFEQKTGIKVHVVAVGTGQALRNGRAGDGDVLLAHSKAEEEKFVSEGYGVQRFDVMSNDFVIVGPAGDPAGLSRLGTARDAFSAIAQKGALFISRGDNSGTHVKERQIWQTLFIDVTEASGTWYRETGAGMGATLNMAVGLGAYTLTDRGTWISFGNRRNFKILLDKDPALFNPYGVILVNPNRHARVNSRDGQTFIDWLLSKDGQQAIAGYKINGQPPFLPNARKR